MGYNFPPFGMHGGPMFHPPSANEPNKQKSKETDKASKDEEKKPEGDKEKQIDSSEKTKKPEMKHEDHLNYINEMMQMQHFYAMSGQMPPIPPHLQAFYQKNGHLPPMPFLPPHAAFYPFMQPGHIS